MKRTKNKKTKEEINPEIERLLKSYEAPKLCYEQELKSVVDNLNYRNTELESENKLLKSILEQKLKITLIPKISFGAD